MYIDLSSRKKEKVFFRYNDQHFGGTEYMAKGFHEKIMPYMKNIKNYDCLIAPGLFSSSEELAPGKTIFWIHNLINQFSKEFVSFINDYLVPDKIAYFVAVSEYHKKMMVSDTKVSPEKVVVIPNAIDPIESNTNKFEDNKKIKIIHVSSPDRGMFVLLRAMELLDDQDIELDVYNVFYPDKNPVPKDIEAICHDKRINFYGLTPRKTVYKAMSNAHIHAYPTVFEETFCLSQVESLSAGCLAVFGEMGSLKEVSLGHGMSIPVPQSEREYVEQYAALLKEAVLKVRNKEFDPTNQIKDINAAFSWEVAKNEWLKFDKLLGDS